MVDLLLLWPEGVDYPLFREKLPLFRKHFNKLLVILTTSTLPSIADFIKDNVGHEFITPDDEPGDWVNNAMRPALLRSNSDWICVMHQDFFFDDYDLAFEKIYEAMETADLIGFNYPTRPQLI